MIGKTVLSAVIFSLIIQPAPLFGFERGIKKRHANEKRLALVVGNGAYKDSPLSNPVNDAVLMAKTLKKAGFKVIEKHDLDFQEMNQAIDDFGETLSPKDAGLFYYAGHGVQCKGRNYLIPVDSGIKNENEIKYRAVDAGLVLAKMEASGASTNIVILDACRDNPFARSFRTVNQGLAYTDAPANSLIAYATAPGRTASDGEGKNGLYTSELARRMLRPNQRLVDIFFRVRREVRRKSGGKQIPWESISFEEPFYLIKNSDFDSRKHASAEVPMPAHTLKASEPPAIEVPTTNDGKKGAWRIESDDNSRYVKQYFEEYLNQGGHPIARGAAIVLKSEIERRAEYNMKRVRLTTRVTLLDSSGNSAGETEFKSSGRSSADYETALMQASELMVMEMKRDERFSLNQ